MLTRRTVLLGGACLALAAPATAADQTAEAFVKAIYDTYKGKDSKGILLDKDADVRRYFAPPLSEMIIKDGNEAAKHQEVGALDGDPFIVAQDWEIKSFDIAVADAGPGKARATVKFTNFDKATLVVLDLVKLAEGWRISEITWQRDGKPETLSSIFPK